MQQYLIIGKRTSSIQRLTQVTTLDGLTGANGDGLLRTSSVCVYGSPKENMRAAESIKNDS